MRHQRHRVPLGLGIDIVGIAPKCFPAAADERPVERRVEDLRRERRGCSCGGAGCAPRQSERGRRETHEARRETHEASRAPVLSGVHAGRRHAGRRKIVRGGRLVGREGRHDVARLGVGQKGQGSADTNFLSGLVLG